METNIAQGNISFHLIEILLATVAAAARLGQSEVCAVDLHVAKVRVDEGCVIELRPAQVGVDQPRALELRLPQVGIAEIGALQGSVMQFRFAEVRPGEVRAPEVCSAEVDRAYVVFGVPAQDDAEGRGHVGERPPARRGLARLQAVQGGLIGRPGTGW